MGKDGRREKLMDSITTTDAGVTSTVKSGLLESKGVLLLIKEEGDNDIEYQVEVCPDFDLVGVGSDDATREWYTLLAWTDLATSASIPLSISDKWDAVRVKARSNVSAAHGTVSVWCQKR